VAENERSLANGHLAADGREGDLAGMSGYGVLRLAHGDWRWVVLGCALWALVRAADGVARRRSWRPGDERAALAFVAALDVQLLLGLVLYFGFSPFASAMRHAFAATMKDAGTRFFAVEHETAMLLAVAAAHVGRVRARRADPTRRHRLMLLTLLVFFAIVAWAIPWPWRRFGRPWLRLSP
jgi:hypothetical protein